MKHSDGTYKDWAKDLAVRENLKESVMYTYYAFYGIILLLAFLVLPLNFFFHALGNEDDPDDEELFYDVVEEEPCMKRYLFVNLEFRLCYWVYLNIYKCNLILNLLQLLQVQTSFKVHMCLPIPIWYICRYGSFHSV